MPSKFQMGWVVKYQNHLSYEIRTDGIFVKKSTAEFWEICVSLRPCTVRVWIEEVSEERKGD
jgi:roadblock/LC7 domain-containing protein